MTEPLHPDGTSRRGAATALDAGPTLPQPLAGFVRGRLEPGERIVDAFEPDLDTRLCYRQGLVVLTDRRLLAVWDAEPANAEAADSEPSQPAFRAWRLDGELSLRESHHGSLGSLELFSTDGRLEQWRFTAGLVSAAQHLAERFNELSAWQTANGDGRTAAGEQAAAQSGAASESEAPPAAVVNPPVSSLKRLLRFAAPRAVPIAIGTALTIAGTAAGLVPPYLTMPLLDNVLIPHQEGKAVSYWLVAAYLGGLGGASLLAWLLSWGRTYVLAWVSERVAADLRNRTYEHLQSLSLEYFGGKRTGDLISRLSSDTDRICYFLSVHLLDFASDVLMLVMTAAVLFWINPLLAVVTLCPLPLIAWLVQRVRNRLRRGFAESGRAWAEMTSVLADTIPGVRVVKAFAQERREIRRFAETNDTVVRTNDRVNTLWAFFGPVVTLLTDAGLLVVWAFGAWQVLHDQVTVGMLTAFVAYISRFYGRLDSLSRMFAAAQRAAASTQRVFDILDRVPSVPEPAQPRHPGRVRGKVELRGVGFQYGNRTVLEDIDLAIEPGELIGLVGPSGAGKSTLVNLVCRFYDPTAGVVLVDDIDIRSFPVEEYRRNVGIVLQEPFLFYGTVAENIAYGRPDASREEIVEVARAARAHEFILRLPEGYDSLVGERGQTLSGGERQRLSIARALLIDPAILILDEATSSVDTETEREIQQALENLIRGRTTIAIAHRLSTLRRADRLVVLVDGRIQEIGRHDELLATSGTYARLHHAQTHPDDLPIDQSPSELLDSETSLAGGADSQAAASSPVRSDDFAK